MKNRIIGIFAAAVIAAGSLAAAPEIYGGISTSAHAAQTVMAPSASLASGTHYSTGAVDVSLTAASGAKIYYSGNGGAFKPYTQTLSLKKNTILKFYAVKDGVKSKTVTRTYRFIPKVSITPNEGSYTGTQTVKLSASVLGVKMYYTTDGSKPTKNSAVYTSAGIKLDSSCTLRILTVKKNWTNRYITKQYEINSAVQQSESLLDDYTQKYAYSTLTANQKKLYAKLFEGVKAHAESINVSDIGADKDDAEIAYWAFDYDNPQFFWLSNGCYIGYTMSGKLTTITPMYSRSKSQAQQLTPLFEATAQEIINKALKESDPFKQVKVLHDEIINMTRYTSTGAVYESEADGPLLYGKALCEGYSKAFMYLCQSMGYECVCVKGDAGGAHMWNMVRINGQWYNVDVTFDDPVGSGDLCLDTYFCLSSADIGKDHRFSNMFAVPKTASVSYKG